MLMFERDLFFVFSVLCLSICQTIKDYISNSIVSIISVISSLLSNAKLEQKNKKSLYFCFTIRYTTTQEVLQIKI